MLLVFESVLVAEVLLLVRHAQLVRRDEVEGRMEVRHSHDQGVNRTAILQIADHRDGEAIQLALCLADGIQVQHGLRGMLVRPVTSVDDRDIRHLGSIAGGSFQMMSHNDQVHVIAYHQDRIFQGLALGGTSRGSVRETDHPST